MDEKDHLKSEALKKAKLEYYKTADMGSFFSFRLFLLLCLIVVFLALLIVSYNTLNRSYSQESGNETTPKKIRAQDIAYNQWESDKRALDRAIEIDTFEVYQRFLDDNPDSAWKRNFIYYRDRAALQRARNENTPEAYQQFVDTYPTSVWLSTALYEQDKAANKNGPPGKKIATNERLDIDYTTSFIEAFDVSSLFFKKGANVKIVRVHNRAQANTGPGVNIDHLTLYDTSTSIVEGGESIGYLTLNDQSSVQLIEIDNLSWLEVAEKSEAHVYGCDVTYSNGTLRGSWKKSGAPFSFQLRTIDHRGSFTTQADTLPPNVFLHGCDD
jgi:hypothetical protein